MELVLVEYCFAIVKDCKYYLMMVVVERHTMVAVVVKSQILLVVNVDLHIENVVVKMVDLIHWLKLYQIVEKILRYYLMVVVDVGIEVDIVVDIVVVVVDCIDLKNTNYCHLQYMKN